MNYRGFVDGSWKNQTHDGHDIKTAPENHPVTRVSWHDARIFCEWLSGNEGRTYRLPTDREWSIAAGIGAREDWQQGTLPVSIFKPQDAFPWGSGWPPPPRTGNYGDESRRTNAPPEGAAYLAGYDDVFPTTAPVMSFAPNPLGLHDLGGNVWEWVDDQYSFEREERTLRGGSWASYERSALLTSSRERRPPGTRSGDGGFRVVLEVAGEPPLVPDSPEKLLEEKLIGTQWTFTEVFGGNPLRRTDFNKDKMDIFESDEEGKWTRIAGQWRWEPVKGEARKIRIYWYSGPEVVEVSKDLKTIHGSKPNWKRFISPIP